VTSTLRLHLTLLLAAPLTLAPALAQDATHVAAASMAAKVAQIQEAGVKPRPPGAKPLRTVFTDREVNAYLQIEGPHVLPKGIAEPRIATGAGGKVTARAIVDLDAVRLSQSRGLLDPLSFVTGTLEVVATGTLVAANGSGTGHLESATVGGIPVPKRVVDELLRFYTRTPDRPQGFGIDSQFELPAMIQSVAIDAGHVTVTQ
jgi:hypothetical protein